MRDRTLRTVPNDPAPISRTTSKSLRKRDEAAVSVRLLHDATPSGPVTDETTPSSSA